MKKIINSCLFLSSFIGYLEWGKGQHSFIFQVERDLLLKSSNSSDAFLHPFVLIPLSGQLIILYTIFQQKPNRILSLIGLACMSVIMLLLFFIGVTSQNMRILGSTIPFIMSGIFVLRYNWKRE